MTYGSGTVDSGNHGDGTARTLGSQSGAGTDEIIVEDAYGSGPSNNTPNASSPFNIYVGTAVILRPDTATQEYGTVISAPTSTRLQIDHDWIVPPTSGNAYIVCYRLVADSGGSVSALSGAPDFWLANQDFNVNSTGALCITEATRFIDKDNGTAATEAITVQDNAYFIVGGRGRGDVGVNGGVLLSETGNPNARDGDEYLVGDSGSFVALNGGSITCMRRTTIELLGGTADGAGGEITDFSFNQGTYQMLIKGNYDIIRMKFIATGNTNEWIEMDDNVTVDGLFMLNSAGIRTEADATDQTLTHLNITFANSSVHYRMENNKKVHTINPVGIIHDATHIPFQTPTNNPQLDEEWRQLLTVSTGTTARNTYSTWVYEGLLNQDILNEANTDSNGKVTVDINYERDTFPSSVFTNVSRGTNTIKGSDWGFEEFVIPIIDKTKNTLPTNVPAITWNTGTESAGLLDGSTPVTVQDSVSLATSHSIIKLTSIAVENLLIGDVITGGTSTAVGTVEWFLEGDGTIGTDTTVVLDTRNNTVYTVAGESATFPASGTCTVVASSETRHYRMILAGEISSVDRTMQEVANHFHAKLSENPKDTTHWNLIAGIWGKDEWVNPIINVGESPNLFETRRNVADTFGCLVVGLLNTGGVKRFQANDGTYWIPATTVPVTITVIDGETEAIIANARVGVEESSSKIEVINALTNGSGVVQNAGYSLPADPTSVDIRVFDIDDVGQNKPVKRVENVTVNGLAITIRMPNNPQYTPSP